MSQRRNCPLYQIGLMCALALQDNLPSRMISISGLHFNISYNKPQSLPILGGVSASVTGIDCVKFP